MNLVQLLENQTRGHILIRKYRNSFSYVIIVDYRHYIHCVNYYPPTKRFSKYSFAYVDHFYGLEFCNSSKEKALWEYLKKEHQKFLTKSVLRKKAIPENLIKMLDKAFGTETDLSIYNNAE